MDTAEAVKKERKEVRQFGLMMGLILGIFGGLFFWRDHPLVAYVLWSIGLFMAASCVLAPGGMRPVFRAWMKFAMALGWVNTHLILFLLYYLIFTPVGLVRKVFHPDPLQHKIDKTATSYWKARERVEHPIERYERPF